MIRPALRLLALSSILALPAAAQQVAFGGLKADPSQPVQVNADNLSVNQGDGTAVFTGKVVVVQGDMKLSADTVQVEYAQDQKSIQRLHATGNVILASATDAAQAAEAVYTIGTGEVVMTGNVLLTQGPNTMSGQKLVVNLKTGLGTMGGRVSTTFLPGQKGGN
ncbi:MAG: lipopolysaccharide transport periplasmic protein LptA [Paracoccaceae bacterium]